MRFSGEGTWILRAHHSCLRQALKDGTSQQTLWLLPLQKDTHKALTAQDSSRVTFFLPTLERLMEGNGTDAHFCNMRHMSGKTAKASSVVYAFHLGFGPEAKEYSGWVQSWVHRWERCPKKSLLTSPVREVAIRLTYLTERLLLDKNEVCHFDFLEGRSRNMCNKRTSIWCVSVSSTSVWCVSQKAGYHEHFCWQKRLCWHKRQFHLLHCS